MRPIISIFIIVIFIAAGCKKDVNVNSGTITIDNTASPPNYTAFGLHIPSGKKVEDVNNSQPDVIKISPDFDIDYSVRKLYFICNNFNNSFIKYSQYGDENSAIQVFNNLKSFSNNNWKALGDSIKPHQIWLFRTSDEKYAKIRIIRTFTETRSGMPFPYVECTFEWVYQPDGTQNFQ